MQELKNKENYKPPKYFAFVTSIMPQLLKLSNEKLGDFIRHVISYTLKGYEEEPYPEDSRLAVYFEVFKDEIDKAIWLYKRKSEGGQETQKKLRGKGIK